MISNRIRSIHMQRKWCFGPKCVFSETDHQTYMKLVPMSLAHWVWPSKYKGKWCFSPKCVFSEMDHTTLKTIVSSNVRSSFLYVMPPVSLAGEILASKCIHYFWSHAAAFEIQPDNIVWMLLIRKLVKVLDFQTGIGSACSCYFGDGAPYLSYANI